VIGFKFRWPGSAGEPIATDATPSSGLPIRGLRGDLPVQFGEGGAVPGDRIVGIMTPAEGITIYPIHSPKLQRFDNQPDRWIDVTWDIAEDSDERFPATVLVTVLNEPGSLAAVAQVIGEADGNIDNLRMTQRNGDFTKMQIELEVWDLEHLNKILLGLKAKPMVGDVTRLFD
jgi:GTP diphosphokinase / guanosine-3',5'-bis(diphosphate) 3'-diphosphatase